MESQARGIPIVLCDRYINHYNFNIVTFEQDAPFFNLVRHLKEEGYTRPVLFTQCWENNSSRRRRKDAILSAIQQVYGYDATEDVYLVSFQNGLSAAAQLDALLGRLKPGDIPAIIGTNSVTTVQTYKAIKSCGLKMPEQIGLCGPEDWNWQQEMNWAQLIEPTITTIDLQSGIWGGNPPNACPYVEGRNGRCPRDHAALRAQYSRVNLQAALAG